MLLSILHIFCARNVCSAIATSVSVRCVNKAYTATSSAVPALHQGSLRCSSVCYSSSV